MCFCNNFDKPFVYLSTACEKPPQLGVITGDSKRVLVGFGVFKLTSSFTSIITFPRKINIKNRMMNSYTHREFIAVPSPTLSKDYLESFSPRLHLFVTTA